MSTRWKKSKTIQTIIIVKSVLLIALWISMDRFYIGDRPSLAEEVANKAKEDSAEAKNTKTTKAPAEGRRSFLDNLLNLPDLDVGTLKREEVSRFLTLAERKKKQVDERLEMLKVREVQLTKIEQSIDDKLKRLDDERRFFAQTVQQEKELKGQRLDRLVELYDKMEPKKAAPVIEKLDKDLVVALFKRLKQKQITTVLEFMKPDKSVELSEYFGRVRSGKEYDLLKEMNVSLRKEFAECKGMGSPEERDPDADASDAAKQGTGPAVKDKKTAEAGTTPENIEAPVAPENSSPAAAAEKTTEKAAAPEEKSAEGSAKESGEKDIQAVAPAPISVGPAIAADSQKEPASTSEKQAEKPSDAH